MANVEETRNRRRSLLSTNVKMTAASTSVCANPRKEHARPPTTFVRLPTHPPYIVFARPPPLSLMCFPPLGCVSRKKTASRTKPRNKKNNYVTYYEYC